ncbi:MAG: winged helix-turn-helix domain-containing protein [Bacteroidales bacterium]|jgi:hypothetical protein|nr:winged helix-turn-helix domain-containing protein [Bacteroidales bacterium]
MLNEKFGINAGLVWNLLNEKGALSFKELKKNTKLTEKDLYAAFGWLAREQKVRFTDESGELVIALI